jgi:hypothetical protein
MFSELLDALSFLTSFRWPQVQGEVTAVDVETIPGRYSDGDELRLAVAYKFYVGADGPYTGESYWTSALTGGAAVLEKSRNIRVGQPVTIRYRPTDPSVSRIDGSFWREL